MFVLTAGIIGLVFESAMVLWLRQSERVTTAPRSSQRNFLSVGRFRPVHRDEREKAAQHMHALERLHGATASSFVRKAVHTGDIA